MNNDYKQGIRYKTMSQCFQRASWTKEIYTGATVSSVGLSVMMV